MLFFFIPHGMNWLLQLLFLQKQIKLHCNYGAKQRQFLCCISIGEMWYSHLNNCLLHGTYTVLNYSNLIGFSLITA